LFNQMSTQLAKPDAHIYTALLKSCLAESKRRKKTGISSALAATAVDKATRAIQETIGLSSSGTFRRVLQRLSKAHEWDAVLRLYIKLHDTVRNDEIWGGMSVAHHVSKVLTKRMDDMYKGHIQKDNHTLEAFILGADLFADWKRLQEVLGRGRTMGMTLSEQAYNTVIKACNRHGDYWLAGAEFSSMLQDGILPSSDTYNAALQAMCHSHQWRQAVKIVNRKETQGLEVSPESYEQIIMGFGALGRWEEAHAKLIEMQKSNFPAHSAYLHAMVYAKKYSRAVNYFYKPDTQKRWYPDSKTRRLIERAERLAEKQRRMSGYDPDDDDKDHDKDHGFDSGSVYSSYESDSALDYDMHGKQEQQQHRRRNTNAWGQMTDELKNYDKKWDKFARENPKLSAVELSLKGGGIGFDDIPWPNCLVPSNRTNKIQLRCDAYFEHYANQDNKEARGYLRQLLLRWHPDKFMQKFSIRKEDRTSILSRLNCLSSSLNRLLDRANTIEQDMLASAA